MLKVVRNSILEFPLELMGVLAPHHCTLDRVASPPVNEVEIIIVLKFN